MVRLGRSHSTSHIHSITRELGIGDVTKQVPLELSTYGRRGPFRRAYSLAKEANVNVHAIVQHYLRDGVIIRRSIGLLGLIADRDIRLCQHEIFAAG